MILFIFVKIMKWNVFFSGFRSIIDETVVVGFSLTTWYAEEEGTERLEPELPRTLKGVVYP